MQKKTIFIVLIIMTLAVSIISLYSSFAYNEEAKSLGESSANYNLIFSLKDENNKQITVASGEEIYVDLDVTNSYDYNVKYGTYYYVVNPKNLPDGVIITKANNSDGELQDVIEAGGSTTISLKIDNNSKYNVDLIMGTLVGFENGDISDLVTDGINLIK